ncbi:hypothetical protein D3C87_1664880 [compost metagenome]
MENRNQVESRLPKKQTLIDAIMEMEDMETRVGITIAAQEAAEETIKNNINAPASIEESILLLSC